MDKEVKYEDTKQTDITSYSYLETGDGQFVLSKDRVLVIEQGENKVILSRAMINSLPKFADRWDVE